LAEILVPFKPGPCPVTVEYSTGTARGALTLGPEWTVRASRELLEKLETLVGRGSVQVIYGAPPGGMAASFADGR
jgi:DNA polymerase III subunit alpha